MATVSSYYVAPIALMEDLVEGATVSGTINGVQVSGTVEAGWVGLYKIATVAEAKASGDSSKVAEIYGDAGNYKIILKEQPESDLTIHLTQAIPAHAVTIPEEYLELTKTNAAIKTAQNAADTAHTMASSAKTAADNAKTAANNAKTAADNAAAQISDCVKISNKSAFQMFAGTNNEAKFVGQILNSTAYFTCSSKTERAWLKLETATDAFQAVLQENNSVREVRVYLPSRSAASTAQADIIFNKFTNDKAARVVGLGEIVMYSPSGKKFGITVDDTGAIKATEVTI